MPDLHEVPTRVERIQALAATERFRWWLVFVVLEMIAAVRAAAPLERDQYWSARAGLENLQGAPLIRPDSWSWSTEGDWVPNSPVWNMVLGLGWQAGGFWGLFWVGFLSISVFFTFAIVLARVAGARALPTLVGFAPILLFAFSAFSPRATMAVQSLLFIAVLFAWWWGGKVGSVGRVTSLGVVAGAGFVVSFAGNWIHLSFMLMAAVIAVMWAVAWWASPGIRTGARLGLAASGAAGLLLGCVASPYGIAMTIERAGIVAAACRGLVSEWFSVIDLLRIQGLRFVPFALVAIVIAGVCLYWAIRLVRRRGRFDARVRIVAPLVVVGVPAVVLGLDSLRFTLTGLLVLLPVAGCVATAAIGSLHRRQESGGGVFSRPRAIEYTSGRFWTVIVSGLVVLATPLVVVNVTQGAEPPEAAVIRELPVGCRVWSTDRVAGPIILMRPDASVWIDGRADFYGRDHLLEFLRIQSTEDPLPGEAECVILPANELNRRLAESLDADPKWARRASEHGHSIWVRE